MTDDDPRWRQIENALYRYIGTGTSIYVMYSSPNQVKIGQALDVEHRLSTLRRELDCPIIMMGHCTASPNLEYELHHIFKDTRLTNNPLGTEWFTFEPILGRLAETLNQLRKAQL